jgi:hypothetical protein
MRFRGIGVGIIAPLIPHHSRRAAS